MLRCRGLTVWGCSESFFSTDGLKKKPTAFTNGLFSAQDSGFTSCLFDGSRFCLYSHWNFGLQGQKHLLLPSFLFGIFSYKLTNPESHLQPLLLSSDWGFDEYKLITVLLPPFPKEKTAKLEKSPWNIKGSAVTRVPDRERFSILISWNVYRHHVLPRYWSFRYIPTEPCSTFWRLKSVCTCMYCDHILW